MQILISGGTGLLGTALRKSLQAKGHQVSIVSRNLKTSIPGAKIIPWDIETLKSEIESTDAVVNLAGSSLAGSNPLTMRWTKKRKSEIIASRSRAGSILSDALNLAEHKPEVFLQASAIGYYGNRGEDQVDESVPPGDDFLAAVCQSWERSTVGIEELGIRRIITRIGLVLSRDGGLLPLLSLPFHFFLGGRIGKGSQIMSWVHITDLVNSMEYLIENPRTQGVYNITAPNPVTNLEFSQSLGSALSKPSWFPIPAFLLKFALGEAATMALDGREVLPIRLMEAGYQFQFSQLNPALSNLFT